MIRRVTRFDCDEGAAASSAHFIMSNQFAFNYGAVLGRLYDARGEFYWLVGRCRPKEFNGVLGGYGAGRRARTSFVHQVPCSRPVAMAVEESADNAAAQHSFKCFVFLARLPLGDYFIAVGKAANMQALRICRPATETGVLGSVGFLDTFVRHRYRSNHWSYII